MCVYIYIYIYIYNSNISPQPLPLANLHHVRTMESAGLGDEDLLAPAEGIFMEQDARVSTM